ncbi:permease [Megasphaera elsdenii CAG:570]|uniref:Permease n=1 Tax=Megasphaera elsdenii CAG:570 TaxID=1263087 RepID=R7MZ64_MEGEL|nr:permease [Megasphaera elsdenii CAG:570]
MVMTHYMELLSLHEPWFLILFMLVPMVLAETILASGAFSLLYKDSRSEKWDSLSHVCGLILGVFFIVATVYIVTSYVPTIQWRGPIDYISIWAYVLGVIPAVLILLQELGIIFKSSDSTAKIKKHIVLMILFVLFTHLAMVFGMADPQLAGYVPPKQNNMQMQMNGNMPMDHSQMDHSQMNHDQMNGQMNSQMDHSKM